MYPFSPKTGGGSSFANKLGSAENSSNLLIDDPHHYVPDKQEKFIFLNVRKNSNRPFTRDGI